MTNTRRSWLSNVWRTLAAVAGISATVAAAHKLLHHRRTTYPANRPSADNLAPAARPAGLARLIRPPAAIDEKPFLAGCIRCYRCQDACEPGAIQFFTETHGKHAHTPYIDPAIKGCTLCMKCTEQCPTGVLQKLRIEDKHKAAMGTVELHKDLCLSHKAKRIRDEQAIMMQLGRNPTEASAPYERRGPCGECHMFCPLREQAIRLEPGAFLAPKVFPEKCVGCGMCEEICRVLVRGEPAIRVVPTRTAI